MVYHVPWATLDYWRVYQSYKSQQQSRRLKLVDRPKSEIFNNLWNGSREWSFGEMLHVVGPEPIVINGNITSINRIMYTPSYPCITPFIEAITPSITVTGRGPPCTLWVHLLFGLCDSRVFFEKKMTFTHSANGLWKKTFELYFPY